MSTLYTVRTLDDQIIIWDEETQDDGKGGYNEFYFTLKNIAEAMLDQIKEVHPEAKFKIVEINSGDIHEVSSFTAEDIHQKAIEQREERNA